MELDLESLSLGPRTGFYFLQGGPRAPAPTTPSLGACSPPYILLPTPTLLHSTFLERQWERLLIQKKMFLPSLIAMETALLHLPCQSWRWGRGTKSSKQEGPLGHHCLHPDTWWGHGTKVRNSGFKVRSPGFKLQLHSLFHLGRDSLPVWISVLSCVMGIKIAPTS